MSKSKTKPAAVPSATLPAKKKVKRLKMRERDELFTALRALEPEIVRLHLMASQVRTRLHETHPHLDVSDVVVGDALALLQLGHFGRKRKDAAAAPVPPPTVPPTSPAPSLTTVAADMEVSAGQHARLVDQLARTLGDFDAQRAGLNTVHDKLFVIAEREEAAVANLNAIADKMIAALAFDARVGTLHQLFTELVLRVERCEAAAVRS